MGVVQRNPTGLNRAPTSTPLNIFGMNLLASLFQTSVPEFHMTDWAQIPTKTLHNFVESLPRRAKAVIAAHRGPAHVTDHGFGMGLSGVHILLAILCILGGSMIHYS